MDTVDPIVTPTSEEMTPPQPAQRRARWPFVLVGVAALLVLAVVVAAFMQVPYYAISPGDARAVNDRISVTGADVYKPEGEELFVTVGVPKLTALGALVGWLDPNTDVVSKDRILGNQSEQQNHEQNVKLMTYSKDFATYVALKQLGYPVTINGGGVVIDSLCLQEAADRSCAQEAPADAVLDPRDVITAIDHKDVHLTDDIAPALAGKKPGDHVDVTYVRNGGQPVTAPVEVTSAEDGRTILGIIPNSAPPDDIKFSFPIDVSINSGAVSGPSAGLAFTLALLDELTPGELTGGTKVAATGTIDPYGNVGEIGGIRQKTVAVQRSGAKLFLVPKSLEPIAAKEAKGSGLEVVGVSTLGDALQALSNYGGNAMALGKPGADAQPAT
jgi:Lon-like protease